MAFRISPDQVNKHKTTMSLILNKARHAKRFINETLTELRNDLSLAINPSRCRFLLTAYQSAKAKGELYHFAVVQFGPHQIKSEILSFIDFAKARQPKRVCEIGVANGGTNFLLAHTLGAVQRMIGIDLLLKNKRKLKLFQQTNQEITLLAGPSCDEKVLTRVREALGGEMLDLLFVDGDHSYDGVKMDFMAYRRLVRPGGIIAFHDIIQDHRARYGADTHGWAGGVPQLWQEIKRGFTTFEFVEDRDQDGCGIGVLVNGE